MKQTANKLNEPAETLHNNTVQKLPRHLEQGTERNVLTHCLSRLEYDQIVDDMLDQGRTTEDDDMIATRRILRPPKKGSAAEIVGKRDRYRVDGSKIMKIYLDPKERNNTEYKLETFAGVYRKFCGKNEVFEYPLSEAS
ncbi:small ribosomal subunit protein eS7-like [Cryptomeria japonica]|uniref:small ribosomal subunit protein eS7-like n=1 Tax=Cryptomeria japonica TaxID=3369 RepID=UPI0027DA9699|nr:small ribosomal subunit protein eS7-like [Cryptomeria japonica]